MFGSHADLEVLFFAEIEVLGGDGEGEEFFDFLVVRDVEGVLGESFACVGGVEEVVGHAEADAVGGVFDATEVLVGLYGVFVLDVFLGEALEFVFAVEGYGVDDAADACGVFFGAFEGVFGDEVVEAGGDEGAVLAVVEDGGEEEFGSQEDEGACAEEEQLARVHGGDEVLWDEGDGREGIGGQEVLFGVALV